jgi:K+-transporting ATPase ATPase B chain
VIRESGGDFSAVTGGTRVLSDWIVVRVSVNPGEAFLDRMIAMVEGAKRQKTPELALTMLLVALTLVFLLVTVTLLPFSIFSVTAAGAGSPVTVTVLVALLVCLIPTTIGGLLSAIGVAGMSRMMQANVIATSGRAVEAAGDVDVLLLDKTGTITLGNRQAAFMPAPAWPSASWPTPPSWPRWPMKRRKAAASWCWPRTVQPARARDGQPGREFVPFTAQTRERASTSARAASARADAIRKLVRGRPAPAGPVEAMWKPLPAVAARRWW